MAELEGLERVVLKSGLWKTLTQRVTLPWVIRFARPREEAFVLEMGSGAGFNAEVFLKRFPGWRLTVSDYDPEMVELSRDRLARFPNGHDFRQADATKLPFPDAEFDIVISIFVWHHVEEWPRATAECARVLKPGGQLILVDFLGGVFPPPVARFFPPMARYRVRDLKVALSEAGFARWRVDGIGHAVYRLVAETPVAAETDLPATETS